MTKEKACVEAKYYWIAVSVGLIGGIIAGIEIQRRGYLGLKNFDKNKK